MIEIVWTPTKLLDIPFVNNLENVVACVFWKCSASNGIDTKEATGYISVGTPDPDTFIPRESLTPEIILGWVRFELGSQVDEIEGKLRAALEIVETSLTSS